MKTIKLLLLSMVVFCLGWNTQKTTVEKNTIVLVKYKTQPDKGKEALFHLTQLIEEVKKEPHFVSLKLHVDPNDTSNILLYEEWSNAAYYNNEHMKTLHLQQFIANAKNFLTGPPDISLWQIEKEF